ncbi:MAG: formylglycine-generating enzyme family protein [Pyrinomonadaceae bacterium]|nr:formylglycine-generating enzyme family protein [Pyrinomonadaceae bacterium]
MICPYCVEDIPPNSTKHATCTKLKDREFPPFYIDFHAEEYSRDPIVLSVVGFTGHGKTVFLCALFDYLDHYLIRVWPKFYNQRLDQESLTTVDTNLGQLSKGKLPPRTVKNFPRPGIFRPTHLPRTKGTSKLPLLEDTTILIYDPPGEAFQTESEIVEFASFVKRSDCVLFLVDILALKESVPREMAKLLDTYLLGMRRLGIQKGSQHLIVVYTKSDDLKVSVPEFRGFLEEHADLNDYLNERLPPSLANPDEHLDRLEGISKLLEEFTRTDLNAGRFIHIANDWFASVSYTVVSSLGAAPEKFSNEDGKPDERLTVNMSPRGVADPLLYVLAKSIKKPKLRPPPPPRPPDTPVLMIALLIGAALLVILLLVLSVWWIVGPQANEGNPSNAPVTLATPKKENVNQAKAQPSPPPGMAYVRGGNFMMGTNNGDTYEEPAHSVTVKPFFIDVYEVSCAEYERFVKSAPHPPPRGWHSEKCPPGMALQPVCNVTWYDAMAYAAWAGKRLPTEEEWEFAARGTDARAYPWGEQWNERMANVGGGASRGMVNVGTFKGASPAGAYDMVGNVWEWTASDLKPYPGGQLPGAPRGELKVIRGGSWREGPEQATTTYRGYLFTRTSKDYSATGFRCVKDVTPSDFK